MTTATAALHGVEKHYKKFTLGPIDLVVPAGSIVGLVGENGAGKTTTLKILTGVTRPDAGRVELLGSRPEDPAARARVGVVFEDATFFMGMTPAQIGRCMAGMFQAAWQADHYEALLERFGLDPRQKMKEFSRGMRMKLNLAAALAHAPELLVLDEPTAGLDPVMRGEILDLFLEYIQDERHSILLSSHITSDLEQVADSIAYLHKGRLLFQEDKEPGCWRSTACCTAAKPTFPTCPPGSWWPPAGAPSAAKAWSKSGRPCAPRCPGRCATPPRSTTSCVLLQGGTKNDRFAA